MTDRNGYIEVFPGGEAVPPLLTPVETCRLLRLDVNGDQERSEVDALKSLDHLVRKKLLQPRRFSKCRTFSRDEVLRLIAGRDSVPASESPADPDDNALTTVHGTAPSPSQGSRRPRGPVGRTLR